jgi:hypothetical protein
VSEERFFRWLALTAISVVGLCFTVLVVSICILFTLKAWQEIAQVMGGGA